MTVYLYTLNGCSRCNEIKTNLKANNILYMEKDVDAFDKEWGKIVKETKNEYLPTLLIINKGIKTYLQPDKDFKSVNEAVAKLSYILKN